MSNPHQELASLEANGFCKELASPKQTALGKDISNPFMAGSLPKTICYQLMMFGLTKDDAVNLMLLEDVIRQDLRLDDADGVECLPNEEIFTELAPPKGLRGTSSVVQWRLLLSAFLQDFYKNNKVDDLSSHAIRYTSPTLTRKLFANMRRVGKGFTGVETPLFASMMVQPQPQDEEEEEDDIPIAPTLPSHTPPPQDPIPIPPQAQPATPSPPQKQPTTTFASSMTLLNSLLATYAELQGRMDDDKAATKDVNVAEPTVFDDEEVTMTMAQILIKMKAEKARLFDKQMAKRLHDEENVVAEQIQEKHLDNIRKYQSLKRKPISIAQAKKNMIIYLKNMVGYKMEHFRGMTYDKVRHIFEREYNKVQTLFKPDKDIEEPQKKRVVEETLLQVKYPIIDWKINSQGSRTYWKIIRVGGITEAYQSFKDMLKGFDREDLVALWSLVKEKFSTAVPTVDKEKALWVELTRLSEPNADDVFWKLQRYMHDPLTWKLYTNCGVHHVSSTKRHDNFMLTEKDYPLSNAVMIIMLSAKLQVEEDSEMARDLVMKIFMEANKPKSRSLETSSK
nr:hypothetical protein [Tanacetum cinerariifolium]